MVEIVIIPAMLATIAWVVYVIVDGFRRRQQVRLATDFHGRLLDRIGSAREFGEFLNTAGGTKFVDALSLEKEGGPATRILRTLQAGIVLLVLGVALFMFSSTANLRYFVPEGVIFLGTICTSLGIGLLLSAIASYVVSKRLGLMNGQHDRRTAPGQPA